MRIVTHTCSNTEIVCALGAGSELVGVDNHSDYPPDVVSLLPKIGPDLDIDIEQIIALKPDLVITSLTVPGHERCVEKIRHSGLPFLVTQPLSLNDVMTDIIRIGEAIGRGPEASALFSTFEARLNRPAPIESPLPMCIEWWPKPVIVPGQYSWTNEMLRLAGASNPFADIASESFELTPEMACEARIEGIIISWCGVQENKYRPHIVTRRPGWENVPAIRHHHIFPISEAWLGRPGPRLLAGIDRLSQATAAIRAAR